jgi:hypothetical protein
MNHARQYLVDNNETLDDYEGCCGELANRVGGTDDPVLYVEGDAVFAAGWDYHMVPLCEGLVHDAWCEGNALPPRAWLLKMFGAELLVEVSLNGETIFDGPCAEFDDSRRRF